MLVSNTKHTHNEDPALAGFFAFWASAFARRYGGRGRAQGSGLRAQGSGLRAQGSGLRAQGKNKFFSKVKGEN